MLIKSKIKILMFSCVVFVTCQSQENYIYEDIKQYIEVYLHDEMFNNFVEFDTLIIYDSSYFNDMIVSLEKYQDKLVAQDSSYNQKIIERLSLIEVEKIQTRQPDIYLPFQAIKDNFDENNTDKVMTWLANVPTQFEAAKTQLKQPDLSHTKLAVEELKRAYSFVSNDLKLHLDKNGLLSKYQSTIDDTLFAIKDYLAFLNSKIINGETK